MLAAFTGVTFVLSTAMFLFGIDPIGGSFLYFYVALLGGLDEEGLFCTPEVKLTSNLKISFSTYFCCPSVICSTFGSSK